MEISKEKKEKKGISPKELKKLIGTFGGCILAGIGLTYWLKGYPTIQTAVSVISIPVTLLVLILIASVISDHRKMRRNEKKISLGQW